MTTTYEISDGNSSDSDLGYDDAVERIADWYQDVDEWSDGVGDSEVKAAVREAIDGVVEPVDGGSLADLQRYADDICDAVARAMGSREFAGHGNYYVSAADQLGISISVTSREDCAGETLPVGDYKQRATDCTGELWDNDGEALTDDAIITVSDDGQQYCVGEPTGNETWIDLY